MALSARILSLLGLALLALGLILHIVGLATPDWTVKNVYNQDIAQGLWETCYGSKCAEPTSKDSKVQASGAFAIIGMLLAAAGLALAFLHILLGLFGKFQNRLILLGCLAGSIAAVVSIIISIIIWSAGVHDSSQGNLGYSFILCIVGAVLIAAGSGLVFRSSN